MLFVEAPGDHVLAAPGDGWTSYDACRNPDPHQLNNRLFVGAGSEIVGQRNVAEQLGKRLLLLGRLHGDGNPGVVTRAGEDVLHDRVGRRVAATRQHGAGRTPLQQRLRRDVERALDHRDLDELTVAR